MDRFKRGSRKNQESFSDYTLLFIVLFLLAFGLVMLYSTSAYDANLTYNDSTYLFRKQIFSTLAGLVVLFIVSHLPYHIWERFAVLGYGVSVALILLIIPFGIEANGAKRWLRVFGVSLQPAEVAKLAMILFLAYLICKLGRNIRTMKGFFVVLGSAVPMSGLIYVITRNLSSAIIIMGIAVVMLFVACPDYKRFIILGIIGIAGVAAVVFLIIKMSEGGSVGGFRGERILAWRDPEAYASGKGFQTLQALYAIGSGGILGKGLGQSMQKLGFLPEAQNDMIFSIICEELGLVGAAGILILFLILIWRFFVIAAHAPDLEGTLIATGAMTHMMIQVILNIAVVTNTIPNTGITLPFISYGGTSVMFLLFEMGLVLNVSSLVK